MRMVIDFRKLNGKTISDAYPLPNIIDILDQLGQAQYFLTFDLASGFHQIPMDPQDRPKTAFSTLNGHYEYARMLFGLKNALATFQRLMDNVLRGLQGTELFVYLDDVVVFAKNLEEHKIKIRRLMRRFEQAKLCLQPDKCEFLRREVTYLGHIVGQNGLRMDPRKLRAVEKFPLPKTQKNVRQFLGLDGYYRRFIPGFSERARPLFNTLKKGKFCWGREKTRSFKELRRALCQEPILQYPDLNKQFILTTDASDIAIGSVLSQDHDRHDLPIAYFSRVLNNAQKNYSATDKECLAIIESVEHFNTYLYGKKFKLVSDHEPL